MPPRGELVARALISALVGRGVLTRADARDAAARAEAAATPGGGGPFAEGASCHGATLVARAWLDDGFRAALLVDAAAAAAELGIATANNTAPTHLTAVANSDGVHNLVVCTLCSCYPRAVLGLSPAWYRSKAYRARAVREPRAVLAEFGTRLPRGTSVRVHDSTADLRYIVLPERPAGTDGWSEAALSAIATRDSLIGVALPSAGPPGGVARRVH